MGYKTREQVEREAARDAGRLAGARDERARLRPLLEECVLEMLRAEKAEGPDALFNQNRVDLIAALRAELGKEG